MKTLKALGRKVAEMPEGFKLHPRVEKVMQERRAMADGKQPLDWGMGETLAYATLLDDGYGIRLSGEDSGTRHVLASPRGAARPEPREMGLRHLRAARAPQGRTSPSSR